MSIERGQDIIDSRDVDERILEIEQEMEDLKDESPWDYAQADDYEDLHEELQSLVGFRDENKDSGEWDYGQIFIHVNYFEEYVQGLVVEIGDLPSDIPGYIEIDWEATSENVRMDYSLVDFDGEEYLTRP
jgi:hypothetical protein